MIPLLEHNFASWLVGCRLQVVVSLILELIYGCCAETYISVVNYDNNSEWKVRVSIAHRGHRQSSMIKNWATCSMGNFTGVNAVKFALVS